MYYTRVEAERKAENKPQSKCESQSRNLILWLKSYKTKWTSVLPIV